MTKRKQIMFKLVKEEADNLKNNLTLIERLKLSLTLLDPCSSTQCIYGQLTGDCDSDRAIELIKTCCSRAYGFLFDITMKDSPVIGSPKKLSRGNFWSPIEVFIVQDENQDNGNNEQLVKYLKGEINTLNFV